MSAGPANLKMRTRAERTVEGSTVTDVYEVFTTSNTDTANDVLGASGLPSLYSASGFDPLSVVIAQRPMRQEDSTTHWLVEIDYGRQKASDQDHQNPPTLRPVKRSATVRMVERALMKDRTGLPILTSAKTPWNPPITITVPHPVARFTRWEDSFSTSIQKAYVGKVNSETFGEYPAGWVMCVSIEATEEWEQDGDGNPRKYWLVTYEFEACYDAQDTFDPFHILDTDYWFIDPNDGERKPIFVDKNGVYHGDPKDPLGATPIPSPIPLKGDPDPYDDIDISEQGDVLQASDLPDAAVFVGWHIYGEANFNDLNLPVDQT